MIEKITRKCYSCIEDNIYLNEMQTKTSIIIPFFQYLGYDTEDFMTFKAEYSCGRERVDYAMLKDDKVEVLIETKKIHENLNNHVSQIYKYMKYHQGAKIGILTNGVEYRFFKRGQKSLVEVWRLNLLALNDNDTNLLKKCKKNGVLILHKDNIVKHSRLDLTLKAMVENPKDELIELIKKKAGIDNLSSEEIHNFLINTLKHKSEDKVKKNITETVNTVNKLKRDYSTHPIGKSFINKGFTKEETNWLVSYKVENDFDLYLSMRFFFNRSLFGQRNFKLSDVMEDYICRDVKIAQHVKNNEKIFASICNKLLPHIIFTCIYIDDLTNPKKPIYINNKKEVAI